jgi:hypothetical protein
MSPYSLSRGCVVPGITKCDKGGGRNVGSSSKCGAFLAVAVLLFSKTDVLFSKPMLG